MQINSQVLWFSFPASNTIRTFLTQPPSSCSLICKLEKTPTRSPSTCADQERPKKSAGMFESHPHGHVTYDAKHRNKQNLCAIAVRELNGGSEGSPDVYWNHKRFPCNTGDESCPNDMTRQFNMVMDNNYWTIIINNYPILHAYNEYMMFDYPIIIINYMYISSTIQWSFVSDWVT